MNDFSLYKEHILHFWNIRFNGLHELKDDFIKYGKVMTYKKNDIIYRKGDRVNRIYYIQDGLVGASRILENGNEVYIFMLGKYCIFPDCFYFTRLKIENDMRFIKDSTVLEFNEESVSHLLDNRTFINYLLYSISLKSLLSADRVHRELSATGEEKLLNLLYDLGACSGIEENGKCTISFTHEELSSMLGMHRTTVSKILSELNKKKTIQCSRNKIQFIIN